MKRICVILLPNQLFDLKYLPEFDEIYLYEHPHFFTSYRYHSMKIQFHALSMFHYCKNFNAKIIKSNTKLLSVLSSSTKNYCFDPANHAIEKEYVAYQKKYKTLEILESPQFLFSKKTLAEMLGEKKKYLLSSFYIKSRRKLNCLIRDGKPKGGKWSFDSQNRSPITNVAKVPNLPKILLSKEENAVIKQYLASYATQGENTKIFFPFTHKKAADWLDDFLKNRFNNFGKYQDAIHTESPFLYHSLLSPLLNSGLITPQFLLERIEHITQIKKINLNSVEGFIRQVIGWREFIRGLYKKYPTNYKENFFKNIRKIPNAFYNGSTGIPPIDLTIKKTLKFGYLHHIERLMIIGNFMLLCEIDPKYVYKWFMELFIDAYDWVMKPNIFGMSQFADGGLFATKPYISSSKYIKKMGNYLSGPWEEIWDALFWRFIIKHKTYFAKNPRMGPMIFILQKMKPATKTKHLTTANNFLKELF